MARDIYEEPFRTIFACVATNQHAEIGKWVTLTSALTLVRDGGAFLNKDYALATAADKTLLGWANRSVDKRAYAVGEQMHVLSDLGIVYQLPVFGASAAAVEAAIDALTVGQEVGLKVDGDKQYIDPAAANKLLTVVDVDQPGRGFIRVKILPSAFSTPPAASGGGGGGGSNP